MKKRKYKIMVTIKEMVKIGYFKYDNKISKGNSGLKDGKEVQRIKG